MREISSSPTSMHHAAATASVILLVLMASLGSAQAPQPVDSGTLTSTSNTPMGTRTSTEEFTIVRNADGGFTMTTVTTEGRRMRSVLTTDAFGAPTAYEHHGRGGESVEKTITSKRDGSGALVISELSTRNPPFIPFTFPANTLLFGEGGFAQLWFLGLGPVPREVSYFEPGTFWRNGVQKARLSEEGTESVTIAGSSVAATHLVLTGGVRPREVWLDSQNRLLKISLGTSLVAVRTTLPK